MENDQKPTNNDSLGEEQERSASSYVRADAAQAGDATRLAQPVGDAYEGSTYVRADEAAQQTSAQAAPEAGAAQSDAASSAATATDAAQSATASADGEAEHVEAEQVGLVQPIPHQGDKKPGGKTRRVKNSGMVKVIAALIIGAIIGGAAGGFVGAKTSSGGTIQAVSTPHNTDKITYDSDGNMTVSSIAAEAMPAVVSVYNMTSSQSTNIFGFAQNQQQSSGEDTAQGYGSGVIISEDGMIVTNYHVIEGADSVVVTTEDGTQYDAEVLGADSSLDLAVLKIDGSNLPYLSFADSDQVQVGDLAVAIGNPLGSEFANTVTDGIVSGIDRQISSESGNIGYIQTNAAINNGNSGGALLNGQAQLIGINSLKVSSNSMYDVEGMGFAIPSNTVLDFVNSVKDGSNTNTSTKKAWVGITGYSLDEDLAHQVGIDQTSGILVAGVTEGGPAYTAGIRMGDVITGVDGTTVSSFEDLSKYLGSKQPGDSVTLTVDRSGQSSEVKVTLGEQS